MHVLDHPSADLCWRTGHLFLSMEDLLESQAGLIEESCVDWYEIGLCPEGDWGITKELKVSLFIYLLKHSFMQQISTFFVLSVMTVIK